MDKTPMRQLAERLVKDDAYAKSFSENPSQAISQAIVEFDQPAYRGDRLVYRIVVVTLSIVVLATAAGAIFIEWNGKAMPQSLVALGSTSLGALAGLLAPSPVRSQSGSAN